MTTRELSLHSIRKDMEEFRRQLEKGSIRKAYRALLSYMMGLRTHFKNNLAGSTVSGFYQGYMDMTYFALFPSSLKHRNLKIAIVFNFDAFRFEAWLSGRNRSVLQKYWELFRDSQWAEYRVVEPEPKFADSIVECVLAENFHLQIQNICAIMRVSFSSQLTHLTSGRPTEASEVATLCVHVQAVLVDCPPSVMAFTTRPVRGAREVASATVLIPAVMQGNPGAS